MSVEDCGNMPIITDRSRKPNFEVHEALTNQRASVIVEKVVDDARSLRSSCHLESSDDPYLQIQNPSSMQNELFENLLMPKCVHGKNESTDCMLTVFHLILKPKRVPIRIRKHDAYRRTFRTQYHHMCLNIVMRKSLPLSVTAVVGLRVIRLILEIRISRLLSGIGSTSSIRRLKGIYACRGYVI